MTDVQQQMTHLKTQIDTGAEETKQYLTTLKKKVEEYDSQHKLSETATSFLQSGIDSASASVDELNQIGSQLQKQSKTASRETIETAHTALSHVKDSLDGLQCKAREFDRKFASSTGSSATACVENVVNATRQRTTDAIEMASEQATRMMEVVQNVASNVAGGAKHTAQVATGETVKAAQMVDDKLGVTPKVGGAVSSVTETVKNLDRRMHVTETAVKIDSKITGGLGAKVVHKGVEMMQESIDYVTDTLHNATLAANKSETAQAAEKRVAGVAETVSSTVGATHDKVMAAKDQAQDLGGQVADKTKDMAGSAKASAVDAKDKTSNMACQAGAMASDSAANVAEGARDMAGQTMEKGRDVKDAVVDKGSDVVDSAKQTGSHVIQKGSDAQDAAKQKGSEGVGSAQDTMGSVKDKGSQAMDATLEKGSHVADTMKSKGLQAVDAVKDKNSQMMGSTESGRSTTESMKEGAKELGSSVKEATVGTSSGDCATGCSHKDHSSTGDCALTKQAAKSADQAVTHAEEKMADVKSRQKSVKKDAAKA